MENIKNYEQYNEKFSNIIKGVILSLGLIAGSPEISKSINQKETNINVNNKKISNQKTYDEYKPGILINKKYNEVKNIYEKYRSYKLIEKDDSYLKYYNIKLDIEYIYVFSKNKLSRNCIKSIISVDMERGEELIGYHLYELNDWERISNIDWIYHSEQYGPVKVKLLYIDDRMVFEYTL